MFNFLETDNIGLYADGGDKYIVIFGDNLIERGYAGTAIVRDKGNVIGIPTKRYPCLEESCFFGDKEDEVIKVAEKLRELKRICESGKIAVFPIGGLGNGLASMGIKSPGIYGAMSYVLESMFGYKNKKVV